MANAKSTSPRDVDMFFGHLETTTHDIWKDILTSSRMVRAIQDGSMTRELYAIYMVETYHYTSHNARNQALVGTRQDCAAPYAKYCYGHAAEEVGHEKMALNDIASLGFEHLKNDAFALPEPLPETERLIAYLYWISLTGNPLQRLGYSYWAESCYTHINPLIAKLRHTLGLEASQLTFFIAHSDIDTEHFEKVKAIIRRTCKTEHDLACVERALENTLRMTGNMLDAVYTEYERFRAGDSARCDFLRSRAS